MIKSSVFKLINQFDEGTFLYFEEDILCYKLNLNGFESFHNERSIVFHNHGKTTGRNNFLVDSEMFKSEMYYFTKFVKPRFFFLIIIFLDRAITPFIRLFKKNYRFSFKRYYELIKSVVHIIIKNLIIIRS
jgi:GT2 family glycosyltransferase